MDSPQKKTEDNIAEVVLTLFLFYKKFRRQFKYIFLFGVFGCLIGSGVGYLKKPKYPSTSSVIIENQSSGGLSSYLNIAKSFGLNDNTSGNLLTPENFSEIGKSKRIIYSTLLSNVEIQGKSDKLINHYSTLINPITVIKADGTKDTIKIAVNVPFEGSLVEEKIMRNLFNKIVNESLGISVSSENSVIKINTTFGHEAFSYAFAKTYLETLYNYFLENMLHQENEMLSLLRQKKDSIESVLTYKNNRYADLSDRTINVVKTRQTMEKLDLMKDIEILSTMLATTIQSLEMTEFSARESKKIFKIIDVPVLPIAPVKKGVFFYGILYGILFGGVKFVHMILINKIKTARLRL